MVRAMFSVCFVHSIFVEEVFRKLQKPRVRARERRESVFTRRLNRRNQVHGLQNFANQVTLMQLQGGPQVLGKSTDLALNTMVTVDRSANYESMLKAWVVAFAARATRQDQHLSKVCPCACSIRCTSS